MDFLTRLASLQHLEIYVLDVVKNLQTERKSKSICSISIGSARRTSAGKETTSRWMWTYSSVAACQVVETVYGLLKAVRALHET